MVEKFNPIQMVKKGQNFLYSRTKGGGPSDYRLFIPEGEIENHKQNLVNEISEIEKNLDPIFKKYKDHPAVIKADLREKAIAKTHRPVKIFEKKTTPIIGINNRGELLLSTNRGKLINLKKKIRESKTKRQKANITAIEKIKNYTADEKRNGLSPKELKTKAMREDKTYLKVILFDHNPSINQYIRNRFVRWIKSLKLFIENISKLEKCNIWKIIGADEDQIEKISQHPAVRTLSFFPKFKLIEPKKVYIQEKKFKVPKPSEDIEYPKLGVIDSGIPSDHSNLSPWIIDNTVFDPKEDRNCEHGCFVAGLATMGHKLNDDICSDEQCFQFVDIQIIPKDGKITEDEIIDRLNYSVPQLSKKHGIKIWNMSLGVDESVEDQKFSSFATFLDEFQDKHNIIITLPSGNNESISQRRWPPDDYDGVDKLQIPGDSVRAITVGALSCKDAKNSLTKKNEPASYSCKGPGPCFIVKPELVHYSGNLYYHDGHFHKKGLGIMSFDDKGNLIEDIGTSYSAPLVARTLSLIFHNLSPPPSLNLIKALAIHSSEIPKEISNYEDVMQYVGFGKPPKIANLIGCKDSEIKIIFEDRIIPGSFIEYPFSWPDSLKKPDGTCRGRIKITLVAESPLNYNFGSEYVRSNLNVSFQSVYKNEDGKEVETSKLSENPYLGDLNKSYESYLIKDGQKWRPIKQFHATYSSKKADKWRIRINLLLRDGVELLDPIKFAMILSLEDPKGSAPVYNEVVNSLRTKMAIAPMRLKSEIRTRVGI